MLTFDFMSYKGKYVIAAVGTLLALWLIWALISLIAVIAAGDAPSALAIIPAALALLWIPVAVLLWKRAVDEHATAKGRLYPGEKIAHQLHAEHGSGTGPSPSRARTASTAPS